MNTATDSGFGHITGTQGDGDEVDLFGWDTVFVTSFDVANKAIEKDKSRPAKFHQTGDVGFLARWASARGVSSGEARESLLGEVGAAGEDPFVIDGVWGVWRLAVGGTGHLVYLDCPIGSGIATIHSKTGDTKYDLKDAVLKVQVHLEKLILEPGDKGLFHDPTSTGGDLFKFVVAKNKAFDDPDPVVTVIKLDGVSWKPKTMHREVIEGLFSDWANAHIEEFKHIFSIVNLNARVADKADKGFEWVKPTDALYAVGGPATDPDLTKHTLATLCMTDKRTKPGQQMIDARVLNNIGADSNSAFAISPERMVDKLLLPGAMGVIHGSTLTDFEVIKNGRWVTNKVGIDWGNFKLDGNSDGKITPHLDKGMFQLGIQSDKLRLQIDNATCKIEHGIYSFNLRIDLTQEFGLTTMKVGDGWVLVPSDHIIGKDGKPTTDTIGFTRLNTVLTPTEGTVWTRIAIDVLGAIVGAIIGGVVGEVFGRLGGKSGEYLVQTDTDGAMRTQEEIPMHTLFTPDGVENADRQLTQEQIDSAFEEISNRRVQNYLQRAGGWLAPNKWKVMGGILGGSLGLATADVLQYLDWAKTNDATKNPYTIDHFAVNCVGSQVFPDTGTFTLQTAFLQDALVLGGRLEPAHQIVAGSSFWPGPGKSDVMAINAGCALLDDITKGTDCKYTRGTIRVDTSWSPYSADGAQADFSMVFHFVDVQYRDGSWIDDDKHPAYWLSWELMWLNPDTEQWELAGPDGVGYHNDEKYIPFDNQGNNQDISGLTGTISPGKYRWSIVGKLKSGHWAGSPHQVPDGGDRVTINIDNGEFEITAK